MTFRTLVLKRSSSHTDREGKQKKKEDLVYVEGQTEVQNNLGIV